jgi:phosphoribosylanthranilate isomerase
LNEFIVKICGITNEEDARVAIEAGANALGFNFYRGSPRYITAARAQRIAQAVTGAFLRVGVFVNPQLDELLNASQEVPLDVVQLHGSACPRLPAGYRVWKSIAGTAEAPDHDAGIEAYLLDSPTARFGGSGTSFDWTLAVGFRHRAIIAGGLDASNVTEAIRTASPWGVDACSRLECSPGKKDLQRMCDFIRAAIAASREFKEVTR